MELNLNKCSYLSKYLLLKAEINLYNNNKILLSEINTHQKITKFDQNLAPKSLLSRKALIYLKKLQIMFH